MPTEFVPFSDIVEANGKTIRENNLEKKHRLSPGTEVRVLRYDDEKDEYTKENGDRGIAFILSCGRDCDGTPLYYVGGRAAWEEIRRFGSEATFENMLWRIYNRVEGGFSEEALEPSDILSEFRAAFSR